MVSQFDSGAAPNTVETSGVAGLDSCNFYGVGALPQDHRSALQILADNRRSTTRTVSLVALGTVVVIALIIAKLVFG
jgi:hypothetical protein